MNNLYKLYVRFMGWLGVSVSAEDEGSPDDIEKDQEFDLSQVDTSTEDEGSTSSPASTSSDDRALSDLEKLLAEEGIDLNSVDEERPEEAQGMSAKEWLISTSDDELIRKEVGKDE